MFFLCKILIDFNWRVQNLIQGVRNFTILIKNNIQFKKYGKKKLELFIYLKNKLVMALFKTNQ